MLQEDKATNIIFNAFLCNIESSKMHFIDVVESVLVSSGIHWCMLHVHFTKQYCLISLAQFNRPRVGGRPREQ